MLVGEQLKADGGGGGRKRLSLVLGRVSGSGFWNLLFQEAVKADSISRFKKQTRFMVNMYKWTLKGMDRIIPSGCLLLFVFKTDSRAR